MLHHCQWFLQHLMIFIPSFWTSLTGIGGIKETSNNKLLFFFQNSSVFVGKTWVTPLKANQEPGLDSAEPTGHELELNSQNLRSLCEGAVQQINIHTQHIHCVVFQGHVDAGSTEKCLGKGKSHTGRALSHSHTGKWGR